MTRATRAIRARVHWSCPRPPSRRSRPRRSRGPGPARAGTGSRPADCSGGWPPRAAPPRPRPRRAAPIRARGARRRGGTAPLAGEDRPGDPIRVRTVLGQRQGRVGAPVEAANLGQIAVEAGVGEDLLGDEVRRQVAEPLQFELLRVELVVLPAPGPGGGVAGPQRDDPFGPGRLLQARISSESCAAPAGADRPRRRRSSAGPGGSRHRTTRTPRHRPPRRRRRSSTRRRPSRGSPGSRRPRRGSSRGDGGSPRRSRGPAGRRGRRRASAGSRSC